MGKGAAAATAAVPAAAAAGATAAGAGTGSPRVVAVGAPTLEQLDDLVDLTFEVRREGTPELYRPADVRIHRGKFRRAATHATLVIAISEQTKQDLVNLYGADPARIRVVHQGCHPAFPTDVPPDRLIETASKRGLPERFLLSVGTVERRKNLLSAVRALARVPGVPLYVVGRRTAYANEVQDEAARLGVRDRVRFLDGVDTLREMKKQNTIPYAYLQNARGLLLRYFDRCHCSSPASAWGQVKAGGRKPQRAGSTFAGADSRA
jgi:glycosyltransferase involved in cell wall biosynthesis